MHGKAIYAVGVDIGGTNLKGGIVSDSGELIYYKYKATEVSKGADTVLVNITLLIQDLIKTAEKKGLAIDGIGIVTPGVVDANKGMVKGGAYNIPGWMGTPFMKIIYESFKTPVFAHNDVTGTVLAEYKYGAGKGKSNIILATFGTGIGGGIVVNGMLYDGATGYAGEIGHMVVRKGGIKCTCGIRGCWEEYVSVRGIIRTAISIIHESGESYKGSQLISQVDSISPEVIFNAAKSEDELAKIIVDRICDDAATGIGSLINIFNPDVFIVGGGISKAGSIFIDGIKSHIAKYTLPDSRESVEIKPAELGYEAGIIGAASLVFEGINGYKGFV